MTRGISEGILALCLQGRLNATSVMTEGPFATAYAPQLLERKDSVQIGLHFNLTMPFGTKKPYARNYLMLHPRLPGAECADIAERLKNQMQKFEDIFGRAPDFIDGHEHVQVMWGVRKIFLDGIVERYGAAPRKPWIRQVTSPVLKTNTRFKAFVLNVLNTGFAEDCRRRGFETNAFFSGVYSLTPDAPYEALLEKWMETANDRTLIMCHPSARQEADDVISPSRIREFAALSAMPVPVSPL
jgi:predicted glycoside hydrolase/deacetylase ChbG (UPF0249 family)